MAEKHFEISRRHFQSRCDCASLSNVFPPWFFTKYSVGFKSTVTELIKADRNQEKRVKEEVKGGKKEITGLETSFSLTLGPPVCLQGPVHLCGSSITQGHLFQALLLLWVLFVLQI